MVGQFVFHRLTVLPFLCLVFGFQHIAAALQPSHSAPVALCTCPQSSSSASAQLAACPKGYMLHVAASSTSPRAADAAGLPGCCLPVSCFDGTASTDSPPQHAPLSQPQPPLSLPLQHSSSAAVGAAGPAPNWMSQCCSSMRLRQMYLPGTHDSGTYMWTTPRHMPLVLDEVLTILINIVGDLSRTQRLDVYEQLQAGARVLDIRLAINPWLAVQARARAGLGAPTSSGSTHSGSPAASPSTHSSGQDTPLSLAARLAHAARKLALRTPLARLTKQQLPPQAAPQAHSHSDPARLQPAFELDPAQLAGQLDMASVGGPLSAAERRGCIVTSHSLPGAPLVTVLRDVRRFLQENPGEVLVLLVKADTIDVNVAGSLRFTSEDWQAAGEVFSRELAGVQLLDERQVQTLTIGQLGQGSRGGGSVLLYSTELQQQGLVAVNSRQARILESWGNGTNTEDLGQLKQRLVNWLLFWRSANWRKNQKPFLLLASAQTTLGVRTILDMVKNRIWRWQSIASAQLQQQTAAAAAGPQRDSLQKALAQWQQLQHQQPHSQQQPPHQLLAGRAVDSRQRKEQQPQRQRQLQPPSQQGVSAGRLGSGLTTLYQLGVETNQQLMQEVLTNDEIPKEFNVWSLDAISPEVSSYIVGLNSQPHPTAEE